MRAVGYPAYVTSAGWLGYTDEKVARLTREAVEQGFTHFKMKVGASVADDVRRGNLIRSIIDDPQYLPEWRRAEVEKGGEGKGLEGKNAGPTGAVLMIDANQVWEVGQAVEYVSKLKEIRPWYVPFRSFTFPYWPKLTYHHRFIEEPTAPDDILGHAAVRTALKPLGIGVATGEHAHNRMVFKQLLQANAVDVVQLDSCRLAGVSEVLSVLLMSKK